MSLELKVCSWCEWVSVAADLIGFCGALALAYPFFRGQPPRDYFNLLTQIPVPDQEDAAVIERVRRTILKDIAGNLHREYRAAYLGAFSIAVAFLMELISGFHPLLRYLPFLGGS
jgi:hypothetical protein